MTVASPQIPAPPSLPGQAKTYAVGTLRYTKMGLFMVFVWLLWGDFVWTMLDGALPRILPLLLKRIGAPDTANQVINKTVGYIVIFLCTPMISFRSDRHRGRWGRRIPYLLWSTPFVGMFLVMIGCFSDISLLFTGGADSVNFLGFSLTATTVTVIVLGALVIGYDFANVFVNTVYWYLFNDVVPEKFLSRFLSLFRIVGTGAIALYNWLVLPHAITHFRWLTVGFGIAYVVGFMAMCFFVKEGQYPPPPENIDKRPGFISSCKTYARECFTHRLYWYFFLANMFTFVSGMTSTFTLVRNTDSLGISLDDLGVMMGITGVISLLLQYPCGWASDKWNPIRVYTISAIINVLAAVAACVWCFQDFGLHGNLMYLWATSVVFLPIMAINEAAELPMYMRLLPKDRYGQFCSANALVRAGAMIIFSVVAGVFIEKLDTWFHMGDWRYRWVPVWEVVFRVPAVIFILLLYREWKRRGGNHGYTPPSVRKDEFAAQMTSST